MADTLDDYWVLIEVVMKATLLGLLLVALKAAMMVDKKDDLLVA